MGSDAVGVWLIGCSLAMSILLVVQATLDVKDAQCA
jgi:hypothetical protein